MTPLVVVLATGNPGKTREFGRLLGEAVEVRAMPPGVALPEETGETFAANARSKALAVFAALGATTAVLADDSGLEVATLQARPGVLSARYAGEGARDEENVEKLLRELAGRADREARFVCSLCLALPDAGRPVQGPENMPGRLIEVEGRSDGSITPAPRGTDGFGYDPVFEPKGWTLTLAEASPHRKDQVSHRGAAARALLVSLADLGLVRRGT